MSVIADTKSQLAKLMATENITVEHRKIQTAGFDPKSRVLYLPIWQNMNGFMYDLLCGHEVGHALYTPAEGWHNAVADESKGRGYKSFLNVVEDARIEKKVKRRYPGLNSSFKTAYAELIAKDFFGIRGRDINSMSFIDRLNIFTKSQYTATHIEFSAQEEVYIRRVQELETWDDVVKLTDEIYQYVKDQEFQTQREYEFSYDLNDSDDDLDGDDLEVDDFGDDGDESDEQQSKNSKSSDDEYDGDEQSENEHDVINRYKDSAPSEEDQYEPECETDNNYRRNEKMLVDEKCKEYRYVTLPEPVMENILTPVKRVQELLTKDLKHQIAGGHFTEQRLTKWVNDFKTKNERFVSLLAKEFEMRKAAKSFSKSKLSETGDIDIGKLASYKIDDNIFRKMMVTPKGKNHGLILLLDKSGSMSKNMSGSIEQILVLTMFCRKVNIPFIVYGFGDAVNVFNIDRNFTAAERQDQSKIKSFKHKTNDLYFENVRLREYINSKMSNAEYTKAIRNMIFIKKAFEEARWDREGAYRPDSEELSNTPLTQAIVALAPIMKSFKKVNNLDLTSLVIVHDGDADYIGSCVVEKEVVTMTGEKVKKEISQGINFRDQNVFLRDPKHKLDIKVNDMGMINNHIIDWFKKTTDSKVFGFYLTPTPSYTKQAILNRYRTEDGKSLYDYKYQSPETYEKFKEVFKDLMKKYKSEKFIDCNDRHLDGFYIVSGGNDLKTDDGEMEVEGKVTASKLKTAFMKFNKKRLVNRVLVSKFISGIAA